MRALSTRRYERSRAYGAHPTDVKGGEAPNKRVKLAAPRLQGRILSVNTEFVRRSLRAIR